MKSRRYPIMKEPSAVRIDVDGVLRARVPGVYRYMPRFLIRKIEKLIRQDELNRLLEAYSGKEGAEFCRGVLQTLDVELHVRHGERMPQASDSRVVFVCNHPLGGLDGMALIDMVSRYYGGRQVWFVVNDLLMAVKPLESVFLPINKHGRQSRGSSERMEETFAGDDPIIIFPAGLCSRYRRVNLDGEEHKMVCDLGWRKSFVNRCIKYHRDVVPLYFSGENSRDFYRKANLRKRLGIKLNVEMVLLPREMIDAGGKRFTVTVGRRHDWRILRGGSEAQATADAFFREVYALRLEKGEAETLPPVADEASGATTNK